MHLRTFSICLPFLASVLVCGCESIPKASSKLPRVELEVTVAVDDSYAAKLDGVDDAFRTAVAEQVRDQSNVGLRFYPVLSPEYGRGQARPPYLMTVEVRDLDVTVSEETTKDQEGVSHTKRWIGKVRCTASTKLQKRRPDAPPLLVDAAVATGTVRLSALPAGKELAHAMQLKGQKASEADDAALLEVERARLLAAIKTAVNDSIASMLSAINRELALQAKDG